MFPRSSVEVKSMCEKEIMIPSLPYPAGKEPEGNEVMAYSHREHVGKKEMRVPLAEEKEGNDREKYHENESKAHEMAPRRIGLDAPFTDRTVPRESESSQCVGGEGIPVADATVVQAEPVSKSNGAAAAKPDADADDDERNADDGPGGHADRDGPNYDGGYMLWGRMKCRPDDDAADDNERRAALPVLQRDVWGIQRSCEMGA